MNTWAVVFECSGCGELFEASKTHIVTETDKNSKIKTTYNLRYCESCYREYKLKKIGI